MAQYPPLPPQSNNDEAEKSALPIPIPTSRLPTIITTPPQASPLSTNTNPNNPANPPRTVKVRFFFASSEANLNAGKTQELITVNLPGDMLIGDGIKMVLESPGYLDEDVRQRLLSGRLGNEVDWEWWGNTLLSASLSLPITFFFYQLHHVFGPLCGLLISSFISYYLTLGAPKSGPAGPGVDKTQTQISTSTQSQFQTQSQPQSQASDQLDRSRLTPDTIPISTSTIASPSIDSSTTSSSSFSPSTPPTTTMKIVQSTSEMTARLCGILVVQWVICKSTLLILYRILAVKEYAKAKDSIDRFRFFGIGVIRDLWMGNEG